MIKGSLTMQRQIHS